MIAPGAARAIAAAVGVATAAMAMAATACDGTNGASGKSSPPAEPRAAETSAAEPRVPAANHAHVDPNAKLPIASEDVAFDDGVPGTIVHPTAPGKYPGVVLMAGSGPTDRDWNSPLIAGKNGSAKLLAEGIAAHGAVVLRFDKAGVGGNHHAIIGGATIDVYRDEGRAALALLRARPDVDPSALFLAGHSEGALHAMRVAAAEGHAIAGVLLLSGTARTLQAILVAQVGARLRAAVPAIADATTAALAKAIADFAAGKPVDPQQVASLPPGLQQLVASITNPATAALSRGLLVFDPLPAVAAIAVPVLVYNGERDIQVDPEIDAKALVAARRAAHQDVTLFLAPEANHVMEHETRPAAQTDGTDYNAADKILDPASLAAIVDWLAKH